MTRDRIRTRASRALLAVAGAGALVFAGTTTPANAAVLSATMRCEALGHAQFDCVLTISGVTAPYSVTWTPLQNGGFSRIIDQTLALGFCNVGTTVRVQATIRDSVGQSLTKSGETVCTQVPQ